MQCIDWRIRWFLFTRVQIYLWKHSSSLGNPGWIAKWFAFWLQANVFPLLCLSSPSLFQSIIELMHLKCKCHGLSGSCEVKTCWWSQPDFRVIGDYLKDKYDSASEMVVEKHRESRGWVETLRPKYNFFKAPTEKDLVYYENSPNFCEPNPETGSFGTRDRICNVTSHGIDGCDLLCCGRGHNTRTEKRKEKCHCIFHWCCYVRCQECIRVYDVHTCK